MTATSGAASLFFSALTTDLILVQRLGKERLNCYESDDFEGRGLRLVEQHLSESEALHHRGTGWYVRHVLRPADRYDQGADPNPQRVKQDQPGPEAEQQKPLLPCQDDLPRDGCEGPVQGVSSSAA